MQYERTHIASETYNAAVYVSNSDRYVSKVFLIRREIGYTGHCVQGRHERTQIGIAAGRVSHLLL